MASRQIFFTLVIILIAGGAFAFLILASNHVSPVSHCITEEPDLGSILNKSEAYSFAYVNAHGQRIAAIDESGHRYFYIYGAPDKLEQIVDQKNQTIWQSNCT
jgi:hypothetical protein